MTDFRNLFDIRIKNYFRHHNHFDDLLSVILLMVVKIHVFV